MVINDGRAPFTIHYVQSMHNLENMHTFYLQKIAYLFDECEVKETGRLERTLIASLESKEDSLINKREKNTSSQIVSTTTRSTGRECDLCEWK